MSARRMVLTIHTLDTFGEEGVIADAAVIAELDATPACVATAVLAGTTTGSYSLEPLPLPLIELQIQAALASGPPAAIRVGLVRGAGPVLRVAELLRSAAPGSSVLAPAVRVGGAAAWTGETIAALEKHALPAASVVVVRAGDFETFGLKPPEELDDLRRAAGALRERGARAVLLAGLFVRGRVLDLLDDEGRITVLDAARVQAPRVPGLAGAHAVALATHLARGFGLARAAEAAQRYVGLRLRRGR